MNRLKTFLLPLLFWTILSLTIAGCEAMKDTIIDASASPTKFSASKGESVLISYSLTTLSIVSVIILDKNDRVVKFIVDREHRSSGSYSYSWIGDDDSGASVEAGIYFYEIIANESRHRGRLEVN